jgi:Ca-activated chloride channel family protein
LNAFRVEKLFLPDNSRTKGFEPEIMIKRLATVFVLIAVAVTVYSQHKKPETVPLTRILFVLDGSQSMLSSWESGTKMQVAQKLLVDLVDSLQKVPHLEMALRVYGHQKPVPPQDCNDTKLEVPFSKRNGNDIKNKINRIRPKGTTPIAHSLELSAGDFPKCADCRNIIILITDGIESCDGDPCAVSLRLQQSGIVLKPFVIGVGIDKDFKEAFECIGRYYDAADENRFKEILDVVINQALNTTTAQVNLLDQFNRPWETNVNMTFYDSYTGKLYHNFIHTMNHKGVPDTLRLDPVPVYKIQVHTIPPVSIDSVQIIPGEHNTISIKTPQGSLLVKSKKSPYFSNLQFLVRQQGNHQILNLQSVDVSTKYLIGTYEIELLTIPRLIINPVEIAQSKTTTIQIPQAGLVTFTCSAPGYGDLYKEDGDALVWIHSLNSDVTQQTLVMLPGSYRVISRSKNAKESAFTSSILFQVVPGEAQKVNLF